MYLCRLQGPFYGEHRAPHLIEVDTVAAAVLLGIREKVFLPVSVQVRFALPKE